LKIDVVFGDFGAFRLRPPGFGGRVGRHVGGDYIVLSFSLRALRLGEIKSVLLFSSRTAMRIRSIAVA
jgi:hypothetical protein